MIARTSVHVFASVTSVIVTGCCSIANYLICLNELLSANRATTS